MSVKSEKIMVFAGSIEAKNFVDSLSEYTDHVYAVVSSEYGLRQHVSGNVTVISRYLDRQSIQSWVMRVGISALVDGTEINAAEASAEIRRAAEELGIDYFKIRSNVSIDFTHTSKCKNADDIAKDAGYTVGNVLMIGCSELIRDVVCARDGILKDRVIALLPPCEESIRLCTEAGYADENIICMKMPVPVVLLGGLIEAKNITHLVVSAGDVASIKDILKAAEIAKIKVSLYGEIAQQDGYEEAEIWEIFKERLGIEEL